MSVVKVTSWRELRERYGKKTLDGWELPIHLRTGQLDSKLRFHSAQAAPYPNGAHIIPIIKLSEGTDNVSSIND
jgi:hypothetical protein